MPHIHVTRNIFEQRVKIRCLEVPISLANVCRMLEIKPQTLNNILRRGNPTLRTLCRLADLLDCTTDYLAGRDGQEDTP